MRKWLLATLASLALATGPAAAQFGNGIVFDPSNYRQNLITAVRNVLQVNNQIRQLNHEVTMLTNQAKDLRGLDYSAAADIAAQLQEIEQLIAAAGSIALTVAAMDQAYQSAFPDDYAALTGDETITALQDQWRLTRRAYEDALLVQAEMTGQMQADRFLLDELLSASQGASGNLQVVQAGNQLTAMQTRQLMQHQLLMASQYRAQALDRARETDARAHAKARFSRFVGDGTAYGREGE